MLHGVNAVRTGEERQGNALERSEEHPQVFLMEL
jgi:hypothetical protein